MDVGRLIGKGISFPPRIGADGRFVWSDGPDNIRECIRIILMTEQRERLRLSEFGGGLGRLLFEPNTATTRHLIEDRIAKALAAWEPRIAVDTVDVQEDIANPMEAIATIVYRLVATQNLERLSLSVSLTGT
jgi:phage baseplate assembly protein W